MKLKGEHSTVNPTSALYPKNTRIYTIDTGADPFGFILCPAKGVLDFQDDYDDLEFLGIPNRTPPD